MPRVKRGVTSRAKHKKVLKLTKGHRGQRGKLFRQAHESMLHALSYQYKHRKEKKGDMRRLWITRINAAARIGGLSYSQLMHGLQLAGIDVDRKILAELAYSNPEEFAQLVDTAKGALGAVVAA